ncbi:MAG TPA: divalent metal cation transporter [Actinomycetota bacterium]|nr:divalent metal cation transporter [Actinomycetota bacterium]
MGPGLVTGASDDDPSGIATYAQTGAQFRFGMLWAALITLPLMAAVQEICDRTALATGKDMGTLVAKRFHSWARVLIGILLGALIAANALNIAADLAAIGSGMQLLHAGSPAWWALGAGVLITGLVMVGSFHLIARVFKILGAALLAYIGVLFALKINWPSVAVHTLVPHVVLSKDYLEVLVAVLGTTISPYLFFWQSAHRVEELRAEPEGGRRPVSLKNRPRGEQATKERTSRADVFTGMAFSNIVMFAIIVATAATLGAHGKTHVTSAASAAEALRPVAGKLSSVLFALGFIASGFLAVPVLAGSGSAGMAGLLHKSWGFSRSPREAPVFYALVAAGTIGGTVLTLLHIDTIHLLVIVAMVNGLAAAPFLVVIMLISGDARLMGSHRNHRTATILGWTATGLMAAAAVALIATGGGL